MERPVGIRRRLSCRRPVVRYPFSCEWVGELPFGCHVPAQVADQHPAAGGRVGRGVGSADPQEPRCARQEGGQCDPRSRRWSLVRCQSSTTSPHAAGVRALKGVGRPPGHAAERWVRGRRVRKSLRRHGRAVDFTRSGVRTTLPLMPTSLSGIYQDQGLHLEEIVSPVGINRARF